MWFIHSVVLALNNMCLKAFLNLHFLPRSHLSQTLFLARFAITYLSFPTIIFGTLVIAKVLSCGRRCQTFYWKLTWRLMNIDEKTVSFISYSYDKIVTSCFHVTFEESCQEFFVSLIFINEIMLLWSFSNSISRHLYSISFYIYEIRSYLNPINLWTTLFHSLWH